VVIPNGQLGLASIRNFSKPDPWSRRSLFVTTPYAVSPQLENPGRERISPLLDDSRAGTKAKSAPVPDFQTRKRLTTSRNGPGASACTQCPACGIVSINAAGNSRMIVSRCSGRR
ncbi:MAG: hypothetical protein RLZZ21_2506, partial [Planctomycetota bacterium]